MKISQKITLGFIIIVILFGLAGGTYIANHMKTKSQIDQIIVTNMKELESAEKVFNTIQETHSTILQLLAESHNEEHASRISQLRDSIKSSQYQAKTSISSLETATLDQIALGDPQGEEDELKEIQLLKSHVDVFFDLAGKLAALLETGEYITASALSEESMLPLSLSVQSLVSDLEMDAEEEIEAALTKARSDIEQSIWISIILTVLASLTAIGLGWFVSKSISANVIQLHEATTQLGKGKLNTRVKVISNDEIGQIAKDINQMAEGLREVIVSQDDLDKQVSERQQAEEALEINEEKFRTIFESSNDTFMLLDRDKFLDCNEATLRMFGCNGRDEFLGTHPSEFSPSTQPDGKNSKESADEKIEMAYRGSSNLFEWIHKRSNGELFPAEVMLTHLNLEGKDILMASVRDITERKQAAKQLRESEEVFRSINAAVHDAIIMLNHEGKISFWNKEAENIFGYAISEVKGGNLHDFLVPQRYQTRFAKAFPEFRKTGKGKLIGKNVEVEALHKDGHEFPIELSLSALQLHNEWNAIGVARDITERKQSENTLKVMQDRHNEAQRIAHLGHWMLDLIKNELIWSDENYRIFGAQPGTKNTYETFLNTVHPEDYEFVDLAYKGSVKNKAPYDIEHRLLMKDGSIKWVNERCETEYADDGSPLRSIGTTLDITERKLAEEALRHSEEHIRLLLDSTAEAIYGIDTHGLCTFANAACLGMLGYDDFSELIGKNMHELMHYARPDGSPYLEKDCRVCQAFRTDKGFHVDDEVFWSKKGTSIPVSYWAHPVHKDDQITGSVVTFLDITEQIKAQGDLAESHEHLRASLKGTVAAVSKAVEARDPYTAGHQKRVAEIAIAIADEMGLDKDQIDGIRMGASIHDIGKIQIPAEMLSKPAKLTDTEYSLIQAHAQVGFDILKGIDFPWPVAEIAHQHHERVDGSGYPQGLKGDEICLEARIVAVADVVEAISSHRPYRPALGIEVALDEISKQRDKFYDPVVVDACLTIFTEKGFKISMS